MCQFLFVDEASVTFNRSYIIFKAATATHDQVTQVLLAGDVDSAAAPQLEACLDGVLKAGEKLILADFTELNFISSSGLRVFLSFAKRLSKAGGRIAMAGMSRSVKGTFELVGFTSIFPIYPTTTEAMEFLKQPGGGTK